MADWAIETNGLVKTYGDIKALDGLDLKVPRGSLAGFVGLNGAGKTTTLRVLLQMARADEGAARVLGLDVNWQSMDIRRRTAFVPEKKELPPYMTVGEAIAFTRSFFPKWRGDLEKKYLKEFGLTPERKVSKLSKGTLTKLHLLLALSRGAELILLDEPTDGLDPLAVEIVMQSLVGFVSEEGAAVLFSSHRLNEMEQIADYLCIIHEGRSLINGPIDDLKQACQRVVLLCEVDTGAASREFAGLGRVKKEGRTLTVLSSHGSAAVLERAERIGLGTVEVQTLSLKEMFLELVKGESK